MWVDHHRHQLMLLALKGVEERKVEGFCNSRPIAKSRTCGWGSTNASGALGS
jgi:hypothetical protein